MAVLEVRDVGYYYYENKKVLDGIQLELEPGKFYAISGPSGCGKTTLLSLIGGLDEPKAGQILYEGVPFFGRAMPRFTSFRVM